jgi:hypothetical protein
MTKLVLPKPHLKEMKNETPPLKGVTSITVLARVFMPLFQPAFVLNSAFENDSSD